MFQDKVYLTKSPNKSKKWRVVVPISLTDQLKIDFGSSTNKDFTIYNKEGNKMANVYKMAYLARHKINEDWTNEESAGFWSRWMLWNKPTIEESIDHIQNKFGITVVIGKPKKSSL